MNKLSIAAATLCIVAASTPATANDQSVMFEIGIGFGNSSGGRTDGNDNARFCKNRNQGRMVFAAIRYRNDNAEIHGAHWWHDDGNAPNCDRDSWAVGAGYVLDSQSDTERGLDDAYATWTPGISYTWGEDKGFKGQDASGTNWRNTGNWQVFNRVAIGVGGSDGAVEIAAHRYGTFNPEHGENFVTIGGSLRDYDDGSVVVSDRGLTPPTEPDTLYNITEDDVVGELPSGGNDSNNNGDATEE